MMIISQSRCHISHVTSPWQLPKTDKTAINSDATSWRLNGGTYDWEGHRTGLYCAISLVQLMSLRQKIKYPRCKSGAHRKNKKRYEHFNTQSRRFEALRDFVIRRNIECCVGRMLSTTMSSTLPYVAVLAISIWYWCYMYISFSNHRFLLNHFQNHIGGLLNYIHSEFVKTESVNTRSFKKEIITKCLMTQFSPLSMIQNQSK